MLLTSDQYFGFSLVIPDPRPKAIASLPPFDDPQDMGQDMLNCICQYVTALPCGGRNGGSRGSRPSTSLKDSGIMSSKLK